MMSGFRAYCDFRGLPLGANSAVELCEDESRHLCASLRARRGDIVDLFDLAGNLFRAEIATPDKKSAKLKILAPIQCESERTKVVLAQCLPKGKTFDDILRQCVEVGASGLFPILSRRSEVRFPSESEVEKKMQKWRAKLIEAIKQSSNFLPFDIQRPTDFETFLKNARNFDLKIVASLESGAKPLLSLMKPAKRICVLIGPEGDMSPEEYSAARGAGFIAAKLGRNVMKCETAALCSLSVIKAYCLSMQDAQF